MKTIHQIRIAIAVMIILLSSCGSAGKKDSETIKIDDMEIKDNEITSEDGTKGFKGDNSNTNLQILYEGLTFGKAVIIDGNDKLIEGDEVAMNSKFSIVLDGIKNYKLVNGKAFPIMAMLVTGDKGPVVKEENLLASYTTGLSAEDAGVLRGTVNVGEPMEPGKQYACSITIKDQNNQDVYIEVSWLFTIK